MCRYDCQYSCESKGFSFLQRCVDIRMSNMRCKAAATRISNTNIMRAAATMRCRYLISCLHLLTPTLRPATATAAVDNWFLSSCYSPTIYTPSTPDTELSTLHLLQIQNYLHYIYSRYRTIYTSSTQDISTLHPSRYITCSHLQMNYIYNVQYKNVDM